MRSPESNVAAAQWSPNGSIGAGDLTAPGASVYGANVFGTEQQRHRLPKPIFRQLQATIDRGEPLNPDLADAVALAMKDWALERGATHYTHWFQPLTGWTAEKHDSFFSPDAGGSALAQFSGRELIKGEPDASSFPSGGVRVTFEARGYTAWDPTSPAFIIENPNGAYLCIPTAFASWTGEALDKKIPLLRSMGALNDAALRALRLFGDTTSTRVYTTIGPEQEYFLIDERFFYARPDLVASGRTLFGAKPAKGQQLDDHYFGSIPERVLAYMLDVERELGKLGVPVKTRHNEVAPGQYEIAPVFENSNVGTDHQQLCMQVMQKVARRYGLVCLLHEKPFAGVNGSGKHNNWSMSTDEANLLDPGDTPHENMQFLFFATAVIRAVHTHQGLLRASIAGAGQDHRLGANEAPPAIISIFLGKELEEVFRAIAAGEPAESVAREMMHLGTKVLPDLPRDTGDRNRTSPFAFTGNRFEFRAMGSSQSPSLPNTVLNTITAQSIDALADELSEAAKDAPLEEALLAVIRESFATVGSIVFDGDGYSDDWHAEAAERGLKNLRTTPDALPELVSKASVAAFGAYSVLNERELHSRYEVLLEQYVIKVNIEAETTADMAATMLLPASARHVAMLKEAGLDALAEEATELVDSFSGAIKALQEANLDENHPTDLLEEARYMRDGVIPAMSEVRHYADQLERVVTDDLWPLPRYAEMLFIR
ncbi:MAG: glutamine synthetase III [Miltoncostaeaceae bacterium]